MPLIVEERVFVLESYVKTMYYVRCRQRFFLKKIRRQAPVKNAIAKMIKNEVNEGTLRNVARNMVERVDKCIEINGHHFQHLL
jgi:hypothetical protein